MVSWRVGTVEIGSLICIKACRNIAAEPLGWLSSGTLALLADACGHNPPATAPAAN